jgi:hypothetical protein
LIITGIRIHHVNKFYSSVVAGTSLIVGTYLDYKLDSVREELSQVLQEIQNGIEKIIMENISHFEFGWEGEKVEIENIIGKLNCQHGTNLFVNKNMAPKAEQTRKNLEKYIEVMQQALRP